MAEATPSDRKQAKSAACRYFEGALIDALTFCAEIG
jgi:hypothetical protein